VKLVTRESARFDNNDSEPKAQVRLVKFPYEIQIFQTRIVKSVLSFFQCQNENECFSWRQLQTTKWKNTEINFRTTGGVPSQI